MNSSTYVIRGDDGFYFLDVDDKGEPMWVKADKYAKRFHHKESVSNFIKRLRQLGYPCKEQEL